MNTPIRHIRFVAGALLGASLVFSASAKPQQAGDVSETRRESASLLEMKTPTYPLDLLARGVEGRTLLRVVVTEAGEVGKVDVVASTHESFSRAAVNSTRSWYFEPSRVEGYPVAQTVLVPVTFEIDSGLQNAFAAR